MSIIQYSAHQCVMLLLLKKYQCVAFVPFAYLINHFILVMISRKILHDRTK